MHVIPLGVDTRLFHPRPAPRVPGRIVAVASADSPVKGIATLLRAVAKLTTERDAQLTVVGKPAPGGPTERLVGELALGDRVRFVSGISDAELAELVASAEIAVVPSLYEGFSLPAVEHMASGTPLVASRTGALPEVTGDAARAGQAGRRRGAGGRAAGRCTTRPRSGTGSAPRPGSGCRSGSPGRRWPGRPWPSTGRRSTAAPGRTGPPGRSASARARPRPGRPAAHADRRLRPVPGRPRRPRARPGLRRRAARVRGAAPRRARGGAGHRRGRAARVAPCSRPCRRPARCPRARPPRRCRRRDRDAVPRRLLRPGDRRRGARAHPGRPGGA